MGKPVVMLNLLAFKPEAEGALRRVRRCGGTPAGEGRWPHRLGRRPPAPPLLGDGLLGPGRPGRIPHPAGLPRHDRLCRSTRRSPTCAPTPWSRASCTRWTLRRNFPSCLTDRAGATAFPALGPGCAGESPIRRADRRSRSRAGRTCRTRSRRHQRKRVAGFVQGQQQADVLDRVERRPRARRTETTPPIAASRRHPRSLARSRVAASARVRNVP